MRRAVQCLSILFLVACSPPGDEPDGGPVDASADMSTRDTTEHGPIVDNEAWLPLDAAADPFDDRPAEIDCVRGVGWDVEPLDPEPATVGIDTLNCNYFAASQPTLRALAAGERLIVQVWHFALVGDGPAHLGVAIDGEVAWETTVEIPSESELIVEEFAVERGASEGAPIVFHLHNHGINSWNLIAIREPDSAD